MVLTLEFDHCVKTPISMKIFQSESFIGRFETWWKEFPLTVLMNNFRSNAFTTKHQIEFAG